ncbi:MAG TPA: sigma-70 family RNA polymerase sigma factor [Acholeplasma sp.]|jgi:RNA polymerase sporulation-specific sigma factor|nr:sigma-70 family RNA polymerase sigma factor [Acholeplasma sp.]
MRRLNDYEIVYLAQTEYDEALIELLINKYRNLIWKNIHLLNVPYMDQDDFFQEGCLLLIKSTKYFNEKYGKTFTKYFELILKRHFYSLLAKLPKYIIDANEVMSKNDYYIEDSNDIPEFLTPLEAYVFQYYFIENVPIKEIVKDNKYNRKQIYNTIYRIKEKYKNMI